jgi:hypothetical protein
MLAAHLPLAWIVARAAGLVAFALLTLSTWLGLAMSTRILGPRRQKVLLGWHRTLVWTGLSMVALHVGALLLDPVLHLGLPAVLVPFAAKWHAGAVAMGVVAGWLSLMLRRFVSSAAADWPAHLAGPALRELRGLRPRALPRALHRYRSDRCEGPVRGGDRARAGAVARLPADPRAAAARRDAFSASVGARATAGIASRGQAADTMAAGGVPERSNGAVLKIAEGSRPPWVRIPPPPLRRDQGFVRITFPDGESTYHRPPLSFSACPFALPAFVSAT